MMRTTIGDVEQAFFQYIQAVSALGDPAVGRWEVIKPVQGPRANSLWRLDLIKAGCRLKLERRGQGFYIVRTDPEAQYITYFLGTTTGDALRILQALESATDHALSVFNHLEGISCPAHQQ